jgi:hypothetical protein
MGYQIRHKEYGIFQGMFLGLGFWHLLSNMPEQGYLEFPSFNDAKEFVDFICSDKCVEKLDKKDITIEKFNHDESIKLIECGQIIMTAERVMPYGNA